jgi:deoxyribose-phosphate aldolase
VTGAQAPWLVPHLAGGLAPLIDHTLLRPEATEAEIERHCGEALEIGFGAVCVNGQWVGTAARRLRGSPVRVAAVAGFPLGANGLVAKAAESRLALADGADEIDMVLALGYIKARRWDQLRDEVAAVVEAAGGKLVKAILETAVLTTPEIESAAEAALAAGAGMLKTSTGFHPAGGATVETVALLRRVAGMRAGVKASGGIRSAAMALAMLRAGADRIGTSSAAGWGPVVWPDGPSVGELLEGGRGGLG